jgi:uncharacterized protein (DUF2336 family)
MNGTTSFLDELEDSISKGSNQVKLRALWHATDLLIAGRYSDEDTWIFGEVIERLARELEVSVRARLSRRIADTDNAPGGLVAKLAGDSSIAVAGPVLEKSERFETQGLVSIARAGSQQHLFAISKRKSLIEPVTDVLVARGNRDVLRSLSGNAGARFSDHGFLQLIKRSENDFILLETLGHRKDMPRSVFQQLIARASNESREKLEREHPEMAGEIATLVSDMTGELHSMFGPASRGYFEAKKAVSTLHRHGKLHEKAVTAYAQSHQLPEVTAALSLLCSLPANVVERGIADPAGEMTIIFAKSLEFSWETTMSLLFLGAQDHKMLSSNLATLEARFSRMKAEAAQSVLQLYQSRRAKRH